MRQHLRLALPPLAQLTTESSLAFVLLDREGRAARGGQLLPSELGELFRTEPVYAILHPDDVVVAEITIPPVSAQRLDAAVAGSIEPMALSDVAELCVAHGPRKADTSMTVAWTARRPLEQGWGLLSEAGLNIVALIPHMLAVPANDTQITEPLSLPPGDRWLAPLPNWSLARDELRPASAKGRWRRAIYWGTAAAAVWIIGLNWYAAQLDEQVTSLERNMQYAVTQAFPQIPVVIDPLRQAQGQRDSLRLMQGVAADDDFIPLAMATALVLDFAQGHVRGLHYDNGVLALTLTEGYVPPANDAALTQSASVQQLHLQKDDASPHTWLAKRLVPTETQARRP